MATEILVYEEISAATTEKVLQAIAAAGRRPLAVRFNTPGGSFDQGIAINGALRRHGDATGYIDALCASAGAVAVLGCKRIVMAQNARFLIHDASWALDGTEQDHRRAANTLAQTNEIMLDIFQRASGKPRATVRQWMFAETWFTAEQARAAGFVHAVGDSLAIAANFDPARYHKIRAADAAGGDAIKAFDAAVSAHMTRGHSRRKAILTVAKEQPSLHRAYLDEYNRRARQPRR